MSRFFVSFFSDRTCCARLARIRSSVRHLRYGVPQGTCLSLVLFNIVLMTLPRCLPSSSPSLSCGITIYADENFLEWGQNRRILKVMNFNFKTSLHKNLLSEHMKLASPGALPIFFLCPSISHSFSFILSLCLPLDLFLPSPAAVTRSHCEANSSPRNFPLSFLLQLTHSFNPSCRSLN